jgi:hypothetical protein
MSKQQTPAAIARKRRWYLTHRLRCIARQRERKAKMSPGELAGEREIQRDCQRRLRRYRRKLPRFNPLRLMRELLKGYPRV